MTSLASAVADLIEVVVRSGVRLGPHRLNSATIAPTCVRLNVGFTPLGVGGVEAVPFLQPLPDLPDGPNPARDNVIGSGADIDDVPMRVLLGCTDDLISSHIRAFPQNWLEHGNRTEPSEEGDTSTAGGPAVNGRSEEQLKFGQYFHSDIGVEVHLLR